MDFERALDKEQTTCINGIFVVFVFLSHFGQYEVMPWNGILLAIGQLMVAPFLFYSGYGIMEQIKRRGNKYIDSMPRKRILKFYVHFCMALSKNTFNDTTGRYAFLSWNTKADGSGRSFTDEQVVQYLTTDATFTLYAQWDDAFIKHSHTSNIKNNGDASGTYASNLATTDTVKIDGAKKLKVEVWVSTESTNYDWLELRDVNGTKLTKDANGTAIGSSGKLGGGASSQKPAKSQVFYITGDTVQFYFKSDSSGNYYGYYAIVTQAE